MITLISKTYVDGLTAREVVDFLLNATDSDYQNWWPGVHLQFHTLCRYADDIGNVVYMDELIGDTRIKMKAVVLEVVRDRKIVWQMKKGIRWPIWLSLQLENDNSGVSIIHTVRAGFSGIGKVRGPLFRFYLSARFAVDLDEHVKAEFPRLRAMLNRAT